MFSLCFISYCDIFEYQAWRNGKLDIRIGQQDLCSQEEPDACDSPSYGMLSTRQDSEVVMQRKEISIQDRIINESMGWGTGGVHHHIHMRTMATLASDPAEWIDSSNYDESVMGENCLNTNKTNSVAVSDTLHVSTPAAMDRHVKSNFDRACSVKQVASFAQAVCRQMFPRLGIWSSDRATSTRLNMNLFMKRIEEFVCLGRWESLNVSRLSRGMKCGMMPWLAAGKVWTHDHTEVFGNRNGNGSCHRKRKKSPSVRCSITRYY